MNRSGLVIVFVVIANTLAADELAELPGQFRPSELSIFLIPKQWFEGEKGDSDTLKLTFPSFPLLVPKSWCGYLFSGLKALFVVMVSELIFLDLGQNPDVEAERSMCLCSLRFPLIFFPSE